MAACTPAARGTGPGVKRYFLIMMKPPLNKKRGAGN
jgi:hypothetical protein